MKFVVTKKMHNSKSSFSRGFILPFTTLITVLILFITTGALALLTKQQYFSRVYQETQTAYYAADDAISCALALDDTYVSSDGLGIFPSSSTTPSVPETYIDDVISYVSTKKGLATPLTRADILCGQSPIFAPGGTPTFDPDFEITNYHFTYYFTNPLTGLQDKEYGVSSSYKMQMDLGIDPADVSGVRHLYRCAKVTVNKTPSFRQIIAQGYSSCNGTGNAIERAVVNTTVIE
jgi:hypothetical protein